MKRKPKVAKKRTRKSKKFDIRQDFREHTPLVDAARGRDASGVNEDEAKPPLQPSFRARVGVETPMTLLSRDEDAIMYLGIPPPWPTHQGEGLALNQDTLALRRLLDTLERELKRRMRDANTKESLDEAVNYLAASVAEHMRRVAAHARVNKLSFYPAGLNIFDTRKLRK